MLTTVATVAPSVLSTLLTHPLDVVKSNVQARAALQTHHVPRIRDAARDIYATHGLRGFARGLSSSLGTYPVFWSVFFSVRQRMGPPEDRPVRTFALSYAAGMVASAVANPLFVIKTRRQTTDGSISVTLQSLNRSGPAAYFRGLGATWASNLKTAAVFPLDCALRPLAPDAFASAAAAKLLSNVLFYPLDMARVAQRASDEPQTVLQIMRRVHGQAGILGVYRGFVAYSMVSVPNFAIMMALMDLVERSKTPKLKKDSM